MQKKFNFKIVIQSSSISWQGGTDRSMEIINGKPVIHWIISKALRNWPESKISLTVPVRDKSSKLSQIVDKIKSPNFDVVWGPENSVLKRLILATNDMGEDDYFIRILGVHYFFSPNITEKLLRHVSKDRCCWAKPPDDFETQLSSEVIKVGSLRKLEHLLSKERLNDENIIRITPVNFIASNPKIFPGHIVQHLPKINKKLKLKMRREARKIFRIERSKINTNNIVPDGDQILFHYQVALNHINRADKVLDIACGEGFGTKLIANKALFAVGSDLDNVVIKFAREKNFEKNIIYVVSDATRTPFPDMAFDSILSMETIEHVNPFRFLKEMSRILKNDGTIIISTPQNRDGKIPINPFHNREYSLKEIEALVKRYFKIQNIIGIKSGRLIVKDDPIGTNSMIFAKKI